MWINSTRRHFDYRGFTRDECRNPLRLFNIMIFSFFSRSHFRSVEKATTMWKRIQERKTEEEFVVATPTEVSGFEKRNLNREQSSFFVLDASNVPANPLQDSGSVHRICGKLQRNRNPNPATKGLREIAARWFVCERSGSCGKLQRNYDIELEKTGLDYHKLQLPDYRYVERVFTNLRHKLNRSENDEMFDLRTNV